MQAKDINIRPNFSKLIKEMHKNSTKDQCLSSYSPTTIFLPFGHGIRRINTDVSFGIMTVSSTYSEIKKPYQKDN